MGLAQAFKILPLPSLHREVVTHIGEFFVHFTGGLSAFKVVCAACRESPCLSKRHETQAQSLGREDPQEKQMATHSSILAWEIPWTENPGRLQSVG